MSEFTQGWLGTLAFLPSLVFSIITWIGGRPNGRIWKRLIAPVSFCLLTIGLSLISHKFSWWNFILIPSYLISCTIGYGGSSLWTKLLRRSLWSLVRTASCLILAIVAGAWTLFILQLVISLIATLVIGILNPLKASQEEGLINFLSVVLVPYMVI